MAGFVASFSVGCWCAIGSLLNQHSLPIASVSVDGCNASTPITSNHTLFTLTNSNYTSNFTEHYVDAEPVIEYPTSE